MSEDLSGALIGQPEQAGAGVATEARQPVLVANGLCAGFGSTLFVRDVDLSVERGEVVALLGANGAGKTTLLMALAGHVKTMGGTVHLNGVPAARSMEKRVRAGLGVVTQERCVFMSLTVRQNLALGLGDAEVALELFPELNDHLDRRVGLLSGGQQQMLSVGRVIAARPSVLLADEVSLGLSPQLVERLLGALASAAKNFDIGVIVVEQLVQKALSHADRALVLRRGRVELEDRSDSLWGRLDAIRDLYL